MNPIVQALRSGYGSKQILEYLSRLSPELSSKISLGLQLGYGAERIVNHIYRGGKTISKFLPDPTSTSDNEFMQMQSGQHPETGRLLKGTAVMGGIAAGGLGLSYMPEIAAGLSNLIPESPAGPVPIDEAPVQPPEPKSPAEKSLFEKLIGDTDLSSIDENIQKELSFLQMISQQLESQGKDLTDPGVKSLKKKIKNVLKGKGGMMLGEVAGMEPQQAQQPQPMQGQQMPMQAQPMQQPQPMQGQGQMGPKQQALMAILQKIQSQRMQG